MAERTWYAVLQDRETGFEQKVPFRYYSFGSRDEAIQCATKLFGRAYQVVNVY
jgi:hypothetical protein